MVRHDSRTPDRSHERGKKHKRHSRERERDNSPDRKSNRRDRDHSRSERSDRDRRHEDSRRSENRRDSPHRDSRNSSSHRDRDSRRERSPHVRIKQEPVSDDEQKPRPSAHLERLAREEDDKRSRQRKHRRSHEEEEAANYEYGMQIKEEKEDEPPVEKQMPNFGLSGKLTEEKNVFNGVVVKYSEPPEARIPKRRWRFYVFKGDETLPTLYLHRQSAYLLGRDRKVADIPVDHPSCSKQHAALQFRLVNYDRPDGTVGRTVRPYIIDLESANGTFVNNQKIEPKRYMELFEKDVLKFGFSSREYVLLHEESKAEASQDDMGVDA